MKTTDIQKYAIGTAFFLAAMFAYIAVKHYLHRDIERVSIVVNPTGRAFVQNQQSINDPNPVTQKQRTKATEMPDSQRQIVYSTLSEVRKLLNDVEATNCTVFYEYELQAAQVVMYKISPPNNEQLRDANVLLSVGLDKVGRESAAGRSLMNSWREMVHEYVDYPKAEKFLRFIVPNDNTHPIKFYEYYVDDEKLLKPNSDGTLTLKVGRQIEVRDDAQYGNKDSWATKRYIHLFAVERTSN